MLVFDDVDRTLQTAGKARDNPGRIEISAAPAFVDAGPKETGKGVGLGLYAARRVISELGGYLDVESEPGKGARFSILLPRVPAQVTAAAAAA